MAHLDDVVAGIAAGLLDTNSLLTTAARQMRCRRHQQPVAIFGGARGGLCPRCIAEDYPEPEPAAADETAPVWERVIGWGRAKR